MKTDDLILTLSADTLPRPTVAQRLARALPAALAVVMVAWALFWGPRADIGAALGSVTLLKTVLPLVLLLLAGGLALALAHPGMPQRQRGAALGLFAAALGAVLGMALLRDGLAGAGAALATPALAACLLSIPVLALPLLAAILWALSAGATLHPARSGAAGGLAAGGLAAAVYSLYCNQDAVLFTLPAYGAAILAITLLGALAGPRVLKW